MMIVRPTPAEATAGMRSAREKEAFRGARRVKLLDWANDIRSAVGFGPDEDAREAERRRESRHAISGHKIILRQRKALGILHLKNVSGKGGCGITDMPLAVGSLVFVELKKPHYFAAEVRWARCLTVGLEFFRPVRAEMFQRLHAPPVPDEAKPKKRRGRK